MSSLRTACSIALLLFATASTTRAQQAESAYIPESLEEMKAFIEDAILGSDERIQIHYSWTLADVEAMKTQKMHYPALITIDDIPALTYIRHPDTFFGLIYPEIIYCGGSGVLEFELILEAMGDTAEKFIQELDVKEGDAGDLRVSIYEGMDFTIPNVSLIEEIPRIHAGSTYFSLFRTRFSASPDNPLIAETKGFPIINIHFAKNGNPVPLSIQKTQGIDAYYESRPEDFDAFTALKEYCLSTQPGYTPPIKEPTVEELAALDPILAWKGPTERQIAAAIVRFNPAERAYAEAIIGRDTKITVRSVNLHECFVSSDYLAYCNYSADMNFSGRGSNPVRDLMNAMLGGGPWTNTWSSFYVADGKWHRDKSYKNCTIRSNRINCTY